MPHAPPWRSTGVLGSVFTCLVLSSVVAGCDTGSSYQGGDAADGDETASAAAGTSASSPTGTDTPAPSTLLPTLFGTPTQVGQGSSSDRWSKSDVKRDDTSYYFMANGWGPGFQSQTVSWDGTSFSVDSMQGKRGAGYEPASYPTAFCGQYSDSQSGECGLPKALTGIQSLRTGWRWNANGNGGQYNAAYDIWLSTTGDISGHSAFLMVWLRDPPGQQPAGSKKVNSISVANAPGVWNIWTGVVGGMPCISYARPEGHDSPELEFDVMDFVRDAAARQISLPGSSVLSVAVGFEIWNGPVTALQSNDFYVQAQ